MQTVKVQDLTGIALNYAVVRCEFPKYKWGKDFGVHHASNQIIVPEYKEPHCYYSPSTKWEQGGPIIEREYISLIPYGDFWSALPWIIGEKDHRGETPLIAAMRCYVNSKLGAEIEIPEEIRTNHD